MNFNLSFLRQIIKGAKSHVADQLQDKLNSVSSWKWLWILKILYWPKTKTDTCKTKISFIYDSTNYTAELHKQAQGIKASRHAPSINHIFYINDLFLFFRAAPETCQYLSNLLYLFQNMHGLQVKKTEIEIWFSPNTPKSQRNVLVGYFGFKVVNSFGKYLGTYINDPNRRRDIASEVTAKITKKLQGRLDYFHMLVE